MSGVEKGPNNLDDALAREVREAKEARVKQFTGDQLRALKEFGIDAGDKAKTRRQERQERREARREARREKWAARGWNKGERVRDQDNRYNDDESFSQADLNRMEAARQANIDNDGAWQRIAVGNGISVPGEGQVNEGEMGSIGADISEQESEAYAGRGLSSAEGGGLTYINEETGKVPSAEDIAAERSAYKAELAARGEKFDEAKFLAYRAERSGSSLEGRFAGRKKEVIGVTAEDQERKAAGERSKVEKEMAARKAKQEKWAKAAPKVDKSANAPTDGLE